MDLHLPIANDIQIQSVSSVHFFCQRKMVEPVVHVAVVDGRLQKVENELVKCWLHRLAAGYKSEEQKQWSVQSLSHVLNPYKLLHSSHVPPSSLALNSKVEQKSIQI